MQATKCSDLNELPADQWAGHLGLGEHVEIGRDLCELRQEKERECAPFGAAIIWKVCMTSKRQGKGFPKGVSNDSIS